MDHLFLWGLPLFCLLGWIGTRSSHSLALNQAWNILVLLYGSLGLSVCTMGFLCVENPPLVFLILMSLLDSLLIFCGIYGTIGVIRTSRQRGKQSP